MTYGITCCALTRKIYHGVVAKSSLIMASVTIYLLLEALLSNQRPHGHMVTKTAFRIHKIRQHKSHSNHNCLIVCETCVDNFSPLKPCFNQFKEQGKGTTKLTSKFHPTGCFIKTDIPLPWKKLEQIFPYLLCILLVGCFLLSFLLWISLI